MVFATFLLLLLFVCMFAAVIKNYRFINENEVSKDFGQKLIHFWTVKINRGRMHDTVLAVS